MDLTPRNACFNSDLHPRKDRFSSSIWNMNFVCRIWRKRKCGAMVEVDANGLLKWKTRLLLGLIFANEAEETSNCSAI